MSNEIYHVCAFADLEHGTLWHDGMYLLPEPNLADGWLPKLRGLIRDCLCVETGRRFPVEAVTIQSISRLGK